MEYTEFFKEHDVENCEDTALILSAAAEDIFTHFGIKFGQKSVTDGSIEWKPEMLGTAFIVFFEELLEKLKSLRAEYSEYAINVADRLIIGFSNNDSEDNEISGVDDEVIGNFAPFITHINKKHKEPSFELGASPESRCTQWINSNVTDDIKVIEDISASAKTKLSQLKIKLIHHSFLPPAFIMVYEELVNVIQTKRRDEDKFKYTINFLNCFSITCRETDDGDEITITPNIRFKLDIKDNQSASGKYDA